MIATLGPLSNAIAEYGNYRRELMFNQSKRGGVAMLHERETDLLKFSLERRDSWYHVNAWGRTSRHAAWRPVWINRCHISYLAALNEFNDTGAAMADWKSLLSFA